ncbi:hypothetical protein BO70DRAFT_86924 [Aspergillus heteromorphus CBS 117.55]|uniref:DUF7492 domain-containing protein n=1 Tax=Aspergillus heteromorphus CBS 117.55 TaxID=1448321 RepID=A0A317X2D8_9EURO|nr:uncharacterized protein BO70DRAFT_86924 [Aspergillus heteromorphus CBS 117.55]PWY91168.1 hypothetical protein BO70DRAFT_86924 [Aspergillus heteromorphus CBS 117.55]
MSGKNKETMERPRSSALGWFLLVLLFSAVDAHSWIEQMTVIASNGTFVGDPGYARGNVLRTAPDFSDPTMTYLIPPDDRANQSLILPTDRMCKSTQQTYNVTEGSPRLQASAGAAIALRYQENGHVTLPWNQPGKPKNRGTIYVYGTTQPKENETLLGVHKVWNADGTGGDRRGVLLSTQNFDDGRCYQINNGNISEYRQGEYPHVANTLMGADLWCQQDLALPSDAPSGKLYTLYWVWDWPTAPGVDPALPEGKQELYTTCMDVDVVDGGSPTTETRVQAGYVEDQSLDRAAIPSEFAEVMASDPETEAGDSSSSATPAPTPAPTIPSRVAIVTTFITVYTTV